MVANENGSIHHLFIFLKLRILMMKGCIDGDSCPRCQNRCSRRGMGGQAISAVGISELVRDKEAVFLTETEQQFKSEIQVLKPESIYAMNFMYKPCCKALDNGFFPH